MLMKLMSTLAANALGFLSLRVKVNRKIDIDKMRAYVNSKAVDVTDTISEGNDCIVKLAWTETDAKLWQGSPPSVEVLYDDSYHFLLSVFFKIDAKNNKLREAGLMSVFNEELKKAGVYGEFNAKEMAHSKRMSMVEADADKIHRAASEALNEKEA